MKSANQAVWPGRGSGVQAQDMRTVSALRAESPEREAVERLSDRALRAAAANPDHSAAARAAVSEAMHARRISPAPWRVSVRSFLDAALMERGAKLFFGWAWRARRALLVLGWLSALVLLGVLAAQASGVNFDPRLPFALGAAAILFGGAWLIGVTFRRYPARLLFVGAGEEGPLAAMLRRELRVFGHVARLDAREAPWVRNARDYRALARRMGRCLRLNLATALLAREALPVRTAAPWRPLVLQLLSTSCDALIVDLSDGDAILADVRAEAGEGRCVFVTLWGRIDAAEASLAAAGIDAPCFFYAPDGEMQRRGQFRAALIAAMRATHRVPK